MKRITLISESEYCSLSTRNDREWLYYSNGVKLDNRSYSTGDDVYFYRLEYDVDDDAYIFVRFKAEADVGFSIKETCPVDVARFNCATKKLTVNGLIETITSERRYSNSNLVASKFTAIICNNHANEIAGKNVYELIKKTGCFNHYAFYHILKYYDGIQSIEKLGETFIRSISNDNFTINTEAGERHKTLNLPKKVVQFIESDSDARNHSSYLQAFKKMSGDDPNEVLAIIDYLKLYEQVSKKIPNQAGGTWHGAAAPGDEYAFLDRMGQIKTSRPDLDLRKVLRYLIKQQFLQMYEVGYANAKFDPIRFAITIPSRLAGIYSDYLNMNPVEDFPQDLYKSHNVLAIESRIELSENEVRKFNEYGNLLAGKYNMTVGDFNFVVPTDYNEFVRIGKTFMNCLPTCGKAFYSGMCDIVFVYKDSETTPKYAIELDSYAQIVQAKTTRDLDITEEDVLVAIDKYVDKLAKI